jgi:hypothetical protein
MTTGYIRNFNEPNPEPNKGEIQRLSSSQGTKSGVEVVRHEHVIVEGQTKVRKRKPKPGDPTVRLRVADMKSWKRVLSGEDFYDA